MAKYIPMIVKCQFDMLLGKISDKLSQFKAFWTLSAASLKSIAESTFKFELSIISLAISEFVPWSLTIIGTFMLIWIKRD